MVLIDYNKSYRKGKIITEDLTLFEQLRDLFSQPVEDIAFVRERANNPKIPDTSYAIQPTGMFDFGLSQDIIDILKENDIKFETTENFNTMFECSYGTPTIFDGLNYENRYYGIETIEKALEKGRGTIVWATGAGKSFLQASLIENIWRNLEVDEKFKCLILVPGLNLVSQLLENFQEYGVNFTYSGWTGGPKGMPLQQTEIVICNSENFCSKFDANQKWIKEIDLLLVDECHKVSAQNVVSKKLQKIKTPHRFGFTGTIPKDKMDEWKIIGTFGPIIYEKNSKELRDEGFLSNACIKLVKLNHKNAPMMGYKRELRYVYDSKPREEVIKKIVSKLNNNVLIIVNHTKHGEDTLKFVSSIEERDCYFINGEMPVEERMEIIKKMEKQTNIITVANSTCFSTGINIKNIHYILFLVGGKSFIRVVQSIGRGLRLHESKNKLTLIDIYDNLTYSMEHVEKRKEFYNEQEIEFREFEINV